MFLIVFLFPVTFPKPISSGNAEPCKSSFEVRSLRFHSPRLCRVAVFLIQTNVSLRLSQPFSHHLFSISLLFLLVHVAFKLRSLRRHSPRLCRVAVFLIQTHVYLKMVSPSTLR